PQRSDRYYSNPVTVTGTGFVAGTTKLAVNGFADVIVQCPNFSGPCPRVLSSTSMSATLLVPQVLGTQFITATNGTQTSDTDNSSQVVLNGLFGMNPVSGHQGETGYISFTGCFDAG